MKKDIRLIAIDLDDTMLHDDNTVSQTTIDTIKEAEGRGVRILVATGRMFQTAQPVGKALGLGDIPMVIYSGGMIQRALSGTIDYENPVPLEVAKAILAMAKEKGWYLQTYIDDELLVHEYVAATALYEKVTGAKAVVKGDAFYTPPKAPLKILAIDTKERLDEIMKALQGYVGNAVTMVRSKETYLEIIAPNASKGEAVRAMAEEWQIPMEQVMAIGNAPNDIPMLEIAGLAVAVANSEEAVKAVAHYVTASNNDDGVAQVIRKFVLE